MSRQEEVDDRIDLIDSEILLLQEKIDRLQLKRKKLLQAASQPQDQIEEVNDIVNLSSNEIYRYSRQLLLADGWGVDGQKALKCSKVLVIGAGGIGSSLLLYLAASGVGTIGIVDFDKVELSNIHRQVIHSESAANESHGFAKVLSAKYRLMEINSCIEIKTYNTQLSHENALEIIRGGSYDVVVDASDNPKTRYLISDACVLSGKPLVSGSAIGTEGQLTVYDPKSGRGCYRCLYPSPKNKKSSHMGNCKSCSDHGVLGTVPGLIGILQATEVLKIITKIGSPLYDKLIMYDSLQSTFMTIKKPPRNSKCEACGPNSTIKSMVDSLKSSMQTRGPSSTTPISIDERIKEQDHISCKEYNEMRMNGKDHVLLDVR